jgi:cytochrome c2
VLSEEAKRGREWVSTCKACHDIEVRQPADPKGGPNLHDVYQTLAGTASLKYKYPYKPPLESARNAGVIWTDENLDQYLQGPKDFLKRVTGRSFDNALYMPFFIGGQDSEQISSRREVIAYLRAIKDQPCN